MDSYDLSTEVFGKIIADKQGGGAMCKHLISSGEPIKSDICSCGHETFRFDDGWGDTVATVDDHVRAIEHIMRALIGPEARLHCDLQACGATVRLPSAAIEGAMLQLVNHARVCGGIVRSVGIRTRLSSGRICVIFAYRSAFGSAANFSTMQDDLSLLTARHLVQSADGQFRIRFSTAVGTVIQLSFPATPGAAGL